MWVISKIVEGCFYWGAWVAEPVGRPALDLGSGHDLTVHGWEPRIGFCTCLGFSLPPSLSLSFPTQAHALSLSPSLKINKLKQIKNRRTIWSSHSTCGYLSEGGKVILSKRYLHSHFTAALFTVGKIRKLPKCPSTDGWIKKCGGCVWCIPNRL